MLDGWLVCWSVLGRSFISMMLSFFLLFHLIVFVVLCDLRCRILFFCFTFGRQSTLIVRFHIEFIWFREHSLIWNGFKLYAVASAVALTAISRSIVLEYCVNSAILRANTYFYNGHRAHKPFSSLFFLSFFSLLFRHFRIRKFPGAGQSTSEKICFFHLPFFFLWAVSCVVAESFSPGIWA